MIMMTQRTGPILKNRKNMQTVNSVSYFNQSKRLIKTTERLIHKSAF